MQNLVISKLNSLYGVQIGKKFLEFYKCKSESWMEAEYDDNDSDYWNLPNGTYIVKF